VAAEGASGMMMQPPGMPQMAGSRALQVSRMVKFIRSRGVQQPQMTFQQPQMSVQHPQMPQVIVDPTSTGMYGRSMLQAPGGEESSDLYYLCIALLAVCLVVLGVCCWKPKAARFARAPIRSLANIIRGKAPIKLTDKTDSEGQMCCIAKCCGGVGIGGLGLTGLYGYKKGWFERFFDKEGLELRRNYSGDPMSKPHFNHRHDTWYSTLWSYVEPYKLWIGGGGAAAILACAYWYRHRDFGDKSGDDEKKPEMNKLTGNGTTLRTDSPSITTNTKKDPPDKFTDIIKPKKSDCSERKMMNQIREFFGTGDKESRLKILKMCGVIVLIWFFYVFSSLYGEGGSVPYAFGWTIWSMAVFIFHWLRYVIVAVFFPLTRWMPTIRMEREYWN